MPTPLIIKETCLTVDDLDRSARFYSDVLGFEVIENQPRVWALSVARRHVLLLFLRGETSTPSQMPGGTIPPHEASGTSHVGFGVPREGLEEWEKRLISKGIRIESRVTWPRGGTSIYFRDPDNHLLELLTPGVWTIY
jgi:catechol 2,3-dioxygenase-like lactoylglutathione lyase family enzyme